MSSTEEPRDESGDSNDASRNFGTGAGGAKFAKVAKVAAVETIADIVGGIADDPFQSEMTRPGGAIDGLIGTTHDAWHEVASAAHHLGGAEPEHTAEQELHSTIHDHADHHADLSDLTHDPVDHPPDHPHHDPPSH